jgi:hypothetical protein
LNAPSLSSNYCVLPVIEDIASPNPILVLLVETYYFLQSGADCCNQQIMVRQNLLQSVSAHPKAINNKSIPVLFANDTSILFTHFNLINLKENINTAFDTLNNWFNENLLCLNFEKTYYIHFVTKRSMPIDMQIGFDNKIIPNVTYKKFLGLTIDSLLTWKTHLELLINKLSTPCYVI